MNEELKKKILNLFDGYIESFACCSVDREELADKLLALVEREKAKAALESAKKAQKGMWGIQR